MKPLQLHQEDIDALALDIHDWLQYTPLAATEEGYDWLKQIIEDHLDKFSQGYRNYN